VQRGDLWILGKHRLLCGDATNKDDVDLVLGSSKPHLLVTDPPYGVDYDPDWRNRSCIGWSQSISTGTVANDDRADWKDAYVLFPGEVAYVWHPGGARQVEFYNSLIAAGFDIRMQIIWAKPHFAIGRGNYHVQHEPCWYAVRRKQGSTAHWHGDRKQTTLWRIDNFSAFGGKKAGPEDEKTGHGTQKPIECMRRPMVNNSKAGDSVYDPFVGSGTTIIAAEMIARRCLAIDIDPAYAQVSIERWQTFTKLPARLESTGQTFEEVAAERKRVPTRAPRRPRAAAVVTSQSSGSRQPSRRASSSA
jgi:DNA modification methylase